MMFRSCSIDFCVATCQNKMLMGTRRDLKDIVKGKKGKVCGGEDNELHSCCLRLQYFFSPESSHVVEKKKHSINISVQFKMFRLTRSHMDCCFTV